MDYLGCNFMEEGINFDLDTVCDCCISHNDGRGLPVLLKNYHGELIDWENLFEIKSKRIEAQKKQTVWDCENCYKLSDYRFKGTGKISEFHFSHCRICNAKCIYCSDLYSRGTTNYNTYPVIKDLIEKEYYKPGGEATMEGGEPTLMQNFDELAELLTSNGTKLRVHTSGIRFSETVAKALEKNMASVVISLDSASEKTYKKLKLVNTFDSVTENIKKYRKASTQNPNQIIIKYIIVPGYNDNIKEIKNFFKLMKKLKISTVALDIEQRYARTYNNKDVSPHIFLLKDYFDFLAKKYNMNLLIYSFISYVLKNRNIEPFKYMNIPFLFNMHILKNTISEKNMNYVR